MSYEQILSKFIRDLTGAENSVAIVGQAFADVAEAYQIAQFKSRFFVAPTFSTREGEDREDVLFASGKQPQEEPGYSLTFHTGENGTATFMLYRVCGMPAFTEQEKNELETILDVLFVHFGRFRMINAVKQIAHTDSLTGLPNSGGYLTYVDGLIERKELQKYNSYYFNLVRFSLVNKRFGVKETDTIIKRYAGELNAFLIEGECIGRLGGDNFVALIKKERTQEFLDFIAEVETYGILGEKKVPVHISAVAGVMEIGDDIEHCGSVMDGSGLALNIAKHVEKKPYVFVTPQMKERMYRERKLAASFSGALEKRAFKAYYQPKVQTDDYTIVGAEALVRWEYEGRLISPREFLFAFEQNGMICQLDFYMIEQVCMDIRDWLSKGIEPVRISVNLSRKHLSNPRLAEEIMEILKRYETESKYIEIELTETVDEEETELLIAFMNSMKAYNVSMSIDDFGTGYSSLNMLRSFQVDVLKIDKSFIDNLERTDRIVLSNIVRMAGELEMQVVAEGVETWQQMKYLKGINCKVVQGFLFDKPMPREAFEDKLKLGKYDVKF